MLKTITEFSRDNESLGSPSLRHLSCKLSVIMNRKKLKFLSPVSCLHSFTSFYLIPSSLSERYAINAEVIKEFKGNSLNSFAITSESFCHLTLSSSSFSRRLLADLSVASALLSSFLSDCASAVFFANPSFKSLTFPSSS